MHLTRDFLGIFWPCAHITLWLKVSQRAHSLHVRVVHDFTCLSVGCFLVLDFFLSLSLLLSLSLSICSLSCTSTSTMSNPPRIKPSAHPHNEEYSPVAMHNPLTPRPQRLTTQHKIRQLGERSALVNRLYCTDVCCEWVSCLLKTREEMRREEKRYMTKKERRWKIKWKTREDKIKGSRENEER